MKVTYFPTVCHYVSFPDPTLRGAYVAPPHKFMRHICFYYARQEV